MAVFLKNMKYWQVVLQEVFLVPPALLVQSGAPLPQTREDLAQLSGLNLSEVDRLLKKIDSLQEVPVEISSEEIPADAIYVDARHTDHAVNAIPLHQNDFSNLLPRLQQSNVIVVGRDAAHAWSAAMYLRDHGCPRAFSLPVPVRE